MFLVIQHYQNSGGVMAEYYAPQTFDELIKAYEMCTLEPETVAVEVFSGENLIWVEEVS